MEQSNQFPTEKMEQEKYYIELNPGWTWIEYVNYLYEQGLINQEAKVKCFSLDSGDGKYAF